MRASTACAALALALGLAGCAPVAEFPDDLQVIASRDRIYVVSSNAATLRSICTRLGLSAMGSSSGDAGGAGTLHCYVPVRHIIVCAEGDQACVDHEERHAREGNFHR
jgi:hypothetical protein